MGRIENLVIVKLGGSLITNKDIPQNANIRNIKLVCREISRALSIDNELRLILIHGGGSFGHYFAKKFNLTTALEKTVSPEGLAKTAGSMINLHSIILKELNNASVFCGTILPTELLSKNGNSISNGGESRIVSMMENGLVPITFGNVFVLESGSFIISGDKIALALSRKFQPRKVIFAMDVDGVFRSSEMKGPILSVLSEEPQIKSALRQFDVTGGIQAKVSTGLKLTRLGTDVLFLNGSKRNRLARALCGDHNVVATKIYSREKLRP